MIVLSANKISQIECLAFLWCLLSHKTSCHPWPESWYNKPEYANGKQSKLAYGFLVEELHQWNSRALQTFPAIRTFAHKNNKTAHRRKSILLLWVMKISKHLLQEFLTVESSERLPNYIDLSCTEIIISLSPCLIQFLNPCDRWILTPKLASVILPSDWSEYNKSSGAFAPFSSCSKRSLLEQFGGLLFPRLFLRGHCLHFFFQGSYQDHKRSCANKARTWLFTIYLFFKVLCNFFITMDPIIWIFLLPISCSRLLPLSGDVFSFHGGFAYSQWIKGCQFQFHSFPCSSSFQAHFLKPFDTL